MAETDNRAKEAAIDRTTRKLRRAMKHKKPLDHAEDTYDEISALVSTILSQYPAKIFTDEQKQAIIDIVACVQQAYSIAARPESGWFARAWSEFCDQTPGQQVKSGLSWLSAAGVATAVLSTIWFSTPYVLRAAADMMSPVKPVLEAEMVLEDGTEADVGE